MNRRLPFFLLFTFLVSVGQLLAQTELIQGQYLGLVNPYNNQPDGLSSEEDERNSLRQPPEVVNHEALPNGKDPLRQNHFGTKSLKNPVFAFDGMSEGMPPDPTGAAGPNHYVQAVNRRYQVFDKDGQELTQEIDLNQLWPGSQNAGDPVVLYDRFADRWVITQFQFNGHLLFAVSANGDPLGSFHTYDFDMPSFPDYPKYSIWSDGYYITTNGSPDNVAVVDRQAMIAGLSVASMQVFDLPVVMPPNNFHCSLTADADGVLPPIGTPNYLFYFEDDAWGTAQDQIVVLYCDIDWTNAQNSEVDTLQIIPTTPFDANFDEDWDDIAQKDSDQKLDAIASVFNFRAQYMRWNGYNTVLLCHAVDVNGEDLCGLRWLELRQTAGADTFDIYQESTYAPNDGDSRFIGSMAMDFDGNIGFGYSISGVNSYPSLGITGRYANDPLGEMTVQEQRVADGLSSQEGFNRYGDYAQMSLDPDGVHFWFTGEYIGADQERKTRIVSFALSERAGMSTKFEDFNLHMNYESKLIVFSGIQQESELVIYNAQGQKILERVVRDEKGQIDFSEAKSGIYFVALYQGAAQRTIKVVMP